MIPYLHLGPLTLGTFGLMMWVAFMAAFFVLRADMIRRRIPGDPSTLVAIIAIAGVVGSKLWHVLETPRTLLADPVGELFDRTGFAWFGGFLCGTLALIWWARKNKINVFTLMDAAAPAAAFGYAIGRIGCLTSGDGDYGIPTSLPWGMSFRYPALMPSDNTCKLYGLSPDCKVHPTPIYEFIAGSLIGWYLWRQGSKALRGPRPEGQVVAEFFILSGVARFLVEFIRINPPVFLGLSNAQIASLLSIILGVVLLIRAKKNFRAQKGEHRILEHYSRRGDVTQPEYHRATPECPNPERWKMYDSMTAEVEVLEFLKQLVKTVKPNLIVETGTFMGISTLWIAEALKENGFGKIITCEYDPKVYAKAKERIDASGLGEWIDARNESSLDIKVAGTVDMLFSDSDPPLREAEVRRFLPQMNPTGLILMHDASSHLKTVRDAALKLEQEGLISAVLMPTPRGLVMAQKKDGRK
jgi:prolipoprotein diacylglyceryl transferase